MWAILVQSPLKSLSNSWEGHPVLLRIAANTRPFLNLFPHLLDLVAAHMAKISFAHIEFWESNLGLKLQGVLLFCSCSGFVGAWLGPWDCGSSVAHVQQRGAATECCAAVCSDKARSCSRRTARDRAWLACGARARSQPIWAAQTGPRNLRKTETRYSGFSAACQPSA